MMNRRIKACLAMFALVIGLIGVYGGERAFAYNAGTMKTITAKAALAGVYDCAKGGDYKTSFEAPKANINVKKVFSGTSERVELPYKIINVNGNRLNCKEVMTGYDGAQAGNVGDSVSGLAPGKNTGSGSSWSGFIPKNLTATDDKGSILNYLTGNAHSGNGGIGYKAEVTELNPNHTPDYKVEMYGGSMDAFALNMIKGINANNGMGYKLGTLDKLSDLKLTDDEILQLYMYYLTDVYDVPIICQEDNPDYAGFGGTDFKIGDTKCRAKVDQAVSANGVYGVRDSNYFGQARSAAELISKISTLQGVDYSSVSGMVEGTEGTEDGEESEDEPTCTSAGGGGALGWILCPVLNFLSNAADKVYSFVEPYLDIDPNLFSIDENESTLTAWETFRNMANVAFIILLLVVIFSQLTGVGIDNYGIKKILPKLILSAVLINASYLICVLAVDLSNIVGNGINLLFNNLPAGEPAATVEGAPVNTTATLVSIGVLGIAGAGAFMVFLSNPAVLLSLLVSALGVVIALFFLFILLAAREAAVVVLVVISPLAFASTMLPNVKKMFFDKWMKMGKALLLLYPICGLMIGGGNYVSRLLMSANGTDAGFMTALMAMLAGIAPIFFIPTVLKNAFAAFGSIGTKLSGLGDRARGGAQNRLRNSGAFRNAQESAAEWGLRRRAGIDKDGNAVKMGRLRTLARGGTRGREKLMRAYAQAEAARNERSRLLDGEGIAAMGAGLRAKADQQRVSDIESLMAYGNLKTEDGRDLNIDNVESLQKFHREALNMRHNATTESERASADARIKAAQNYLSKLDKGRGAVQENLQNAINYGQLDAAHVAASHLNSNYADLYKQKNRGANNMIGDLASVSVSDSNPEGNQEVLERIRRKISDGSYELGGAEKYDQASLAGADEAALRNMRNAATRVVEKISNGQAVTEDELRAVRAISGTASRVVGMYNEGKLSVKPEALRDIEAIASITIPGDSSNNLHNNSPYGNNLDS